MRDLKILEYFGINMEVDSMESSKTAPSQEDLQILLKSLKGYLEYMKICGVEEVPLKNMPDFQNQMKPATQGTKFTAVQRPVSFQKEEIPVGTKQTSIEAGDLFSKVEKDATPLSLEEVKQELGDCKRCKLHKGRTNIVFGVGNPKADLVFVGEGPGKDEDLQGEPFVGRAGQLLTKIIENGMKLNRKDVYICNIVKCRPPGNRDPEKDEVAACSRFLVKQLRAIKPKVIVALGKPSASTLLGRNVPIMKERGTWHQLEGIKLMLTYHPSFILRRYTEEIRKQVYNDMLAVLEELKK